MRATGKWRRLRDDTGSNAVQAAAVALLAAALIGVMLGFAPQLSGATERAFACLIGSLGGGDECEGGAAVADRGAARPLTGAPQTGQNIAQAPQPRCPSVANAGVYEHDAPTDTASLYRNINDLYQTPNQTMAQQKGPIGITEIGDNRYLVTMVGIEWQNWGEKFNFLPNAARDQLNIESQYQQHVRDLLQAQIPPGAEIVFAAHSHGGIVAQNLARDALISGQYRVSHVITYGAPVSGPPADGVDYTMFEIAGDIVPGAGIVHLPSFARLFGRGDYHIIAPDRWRWNPMEYHSVYAQALERLRDRSDKAQLLQLPFTIERWGPTRTYQANATAAAELRAACQ